MSSNENRVAVAVIEVGNCAGSAVDNGVSGALQAPGI